MQFVIGAVICGVLWRGGATPNLLPARWLCLLDDKSRPAERSSLGRDRLCPSPDEIVAILIGCGGQLP
jgi:hypothetical protein